MSTGSHAWLDQWAVGVRAQAAVEHDTSDGWSPLAWRDWEELDPIQSQAPHVHHTLWLTCIQLMAVQAKLSCATAVKAYPAQDLDLSSAVRLLQQGLPGHATHVLLPDPGDAPQYLLDALTRCVEAGGMAALALGHGKERYDNEDPNEWVLVTGLTRPWSPTVASPQAVHPSVLSLQQASSLWILSPSLDDVWGMPANARLDPMSELGTQAVQLRSLDGRVQQRRWTAALLVSPT